jgi:hypothetical protein
MTYVNISAFSRARCAPRVGNRNGTGQHDQRIMRLSFHRILGWGIGLSLLFFVAVGAAFAQVSQGSISGTVMDAGGAAVVGARVTVTSEATNQSRNLTTGDTGLYQVQGVEPGSYTVTITADGFQSSVVKGLHLDPGQHRDNNVTLQVGATSQTVMVEADALQVDTQSAENAGVISSSQVSNIMLNGRNFESLGQTVAGVSSTSGGNAGTGGGLMGGNTLIINGQSIVYTLYTLDGVEDMNTGNLSGVNVLPIIDAIDEFRVAKSSPSAKYGFGGGAQVVIQTKSGSTEYHGSGWDYMRNNAFDSRNYFNSTVSPLHQNIFGYSLGGPLKIPHLYDGKKTFFFAANEWRIAHQGITLAGAVFTPDQRAGNFANSTTLASGGLSLDAHSQALLASEGKSNCILNSTTLNSACFDSTAVAIMNKFIPSANNTNGGFNNYLNTTSDDASQLDYNYRIDHYFSQNEVFTGRAVYEEVNDAFPYNNFTGSPFSTVAWNVYTTGANYMGRLSSTITPNLVNAFSVAESYDKPRIKTPNQTMPSGVSITQSYPDADIQNRFPQITFSNGYSELSSWYSPIHASDGEGMIYDDVTYTHKKHTIQAGWFYIFGVKNQNVMTLPQGAFTFSGVHTGDVAADYMLGLDATYTQNSGQPSGSFHYRQNEAYFQDDWKVLPKLTLNLGIRYSYLSPDTVKGNKMTSFFPSTYSNSTAPAVAVDGTISTNAAGVELTAAGGTANTLDGIVYGGQNGVPNGFYKGKKDLFAPRVGFAYALGNKDMSSIRGGWSFGYVHLPVQFAYLDFGQNPPYNASSNILNSTISNGTLGTGATPTPQALNTIPSTFMPAQLQTFSLTLEQQFTPNLLASIGYAGSIVHHIVATNNINTALPVTSPSTSGCLGTQAASSKYDFDPCIATGAASSSYTVPYQGWAGIKQEDSPGYSNYNGLQTALQYHSTHLQISPSYTYSKALTTVGGRAAAGTGSVTDDTVQNYRNWGADYGPPSYDRPHVFTVSLMYDLPFFKDAQPLLRSTLGGWSFSGMSVMESGYALTPGLSTSTAGLAIRPNIVSKVHKVGNVDQWFSISSYAAPGLGFYGNAKTGSIRGPAEFTGSAALKKNIPLEGKCNLQFRAEAFNIANHTNFSGVQISYGAGNFGAVTSAQDPRILEFALKLTY